jgi:[phosphatase 2A protein]-leucine-carboxy methyltransferase
MVSNLTTRGIVLQTLEKYHDLEEQRRRLHDHGFGRQENRDRSGYGAQAVDIDFIWGRWIDENEKDRVEKLEWMDEVEEFVLLAKHYCVAWGWRGFENENAWKQIPSPG